MASKSVWARSASGSCRSHSTQSEFSTAGVLKCSDRGSSQERVRPARIEPCVHLPTGVRAAVRLCAGQGLRELCELGVTRPADQPDPDWHMAVDPDGEDPHRVPVRPS
jgi:hypothetical protein